MARQAKDEEREERIELLDEEDWACKRIERVHQWFAPSDWQTTRRNLLPSAGSRYAPPWPSDHTRGVR